MPNLPLFLASFRLPMFGFTCISFLMLLVVLAIATWLVFRSGEKGTTRLSGCAGCAIGFALLAIAGLGALGCVAVAVIGAPVEMVRHGPFRKFEFHWPEDEQREGGEGSGDWETTEEGAAPGEPDLPGTSDRYPAHLSITLREDADLSEVAGAISEWLREESDGDLEVRIRAGEGERETRLEFRLPISREELLELREELRRELPRLRLPERIEIEVRGDDE